jgi:hypothetical protein
VITSTATLLVTLLALYPGPQSQCIRSRADAIAASADAASVTYGVPASVLLTTAFLETHIGCDAGEGGGLGAPASRTRRHVAGGWEQHGSALRLGFVRCRSWRGAISHYRIGRCRGRVPRGYTAETALHIAARVDPGLR